MRKVLLLLQVLICLKLSGQINSTHALETNSFMNDANGRPLYQQSAYTVEGHPYYLDTYHPATIVGANGKIYKDVMVKLNLLENLVQYKTASGDEMVANSDIRTVIFKNLVNGQSLVSFQSGFAPIEKQNKNSFYEVIDSGAVSLLKFHRVSYTDQKGYGQSTTTRVFNTKENFYISLPGNQIKKLDKGKEFLIDILPSKKDQVAAFIRQQNISCRSVADWKRVIQYYNSLP